MASRDDKLAENQDMSRSTNERLQDVAGRTAEDGIVIPFLCECADDECMGLEPFQHFRSLTQARSIRMAKLRFCPPPATRTPTIRPRSATAAMVFAV